MHHLSDPHQQFAECFDNKHVKPIAYLLMKRLTEGHTCIHLNELQTAQADMPYTVTALPTPAQLAPFVSVAPHTVAPFVLDGERLYLQRYYQYETQIIRCLQQLVTNSKALRAERMANLLPLKSVIASMSADYPTESLSDAEKIDWQLSASLVAMLNNFSIITGGPGTGKTTTLTKLLRLIYATQPNANVALAAPTGKASMRMFESLNASAQRLNDAEFAHKINLLQPSTLHALLGYVKNSIYFKHNASNPLPYHWVIIDEASMIDVPMFAKLLDALGSNCRLVLLGDKDQLASVEAGSLLGDFCNAFTEINQFTPDTLAWINGFIPDCNRQITPSYLGTHPSLLAGCMVQLKLSHRFKQLGLIGQLSSAIIHNQQANLQQLLSASHTDLQIDEAYSETVLAAFVKHYHQYLHTADIAQALKALNSCRVLVAVREGPQGLYALNKKIETLLFLQKQLQPSGGFYLHRPIMVTKNNYELQLFNGDVGIIRPDANGQLRAWFEDANGGVRSILPAYLNDVETVFAMTIHKSQGSEFDNVLIVLPTADSNNPLLTRELLYTAVTRAKKSVVLQGTRAGIGAAASASVKRMSGIGHQLLQP